MKIKEILDEISAEGGTNAKMDILRKYKDNELLIQVLYKACSRRVKFYIKQIPEYTEALRWNMSLEEALTELDKFSNRELTGNAAIDHLSTVLSKLSTDDAAGGFMISFLVSIFRL